MDDAARRVPAALKTELGELWQRATHLTLVFSNEVTTPEVKDALHLVAWGECVELCARPPTTPAPLHRKLLSTAAPGSDQCDRPHACSGHKSSG